MKILIACEESQTVCDEFRKLGHEAYSCDILPTSGKHPEWHLQQDVLPLLELEWDMIIAFPPCTYLTITGNRWFNVEKYGDKALQRIKNREAAINFFLLLANAKCEKIAIENPIGIMSSIWRKPDQIIQPWMFGDSFQKSTCLWLKGLPKLIPTNIVDKGKMQKLVSGKSIPEWYSNAPKKNRAEIRSKTFIGIAKAMASQWSFNDTF
jgi:hypothetical protein